MAAFPVGGEVKLDLATAWLKAPTVWALGAFLVSATLLYARMDAAIVQLQGGQAEIVKGVGDMRDDLRKLVTENISQREFDAWLKLLKAMNPSLSLPEAPR